MKDTHGTKARLAMLNHKGFTLVEVLIALLVLGIIFVPVSNAFLQSVHLNQHLKQRVLAVREAQTAMEVTLSLLNELDRSEPDMSEEVSEKDGEDSSLETAERAKKVEHNEPMEEEIISLFANFDTSGLIKTETIVDIAPLHQDSPFFVITAASSFVTGDTTDNFTLTTLHLPGQAPWLTPKEYRVVTP